MRKSEGIFLASTLLLLVIIYLSTTLMNLGVRAIRNDSIELDEYDIHVEILEPYGNREGTIVLIHGILGASDMLRPMATDLVRVGWRVILIDQIGHGRSGGSYKLYFDEIRNLSRDLEELVNQTKGFRKAIALYVSDIIEKNEKVVFGGHSFGGLLAVLISMEFDHMFNVVATIGIAPPYFENATNKDLPRNLLLCLGEHDEFISVDSLKKFIRPDIPEAVEVGKILGDPSNGTARKLYVSPYSNHMFEPYDPLIIGEIIKWLDLCNGLEPRRPIVLSTPMVLLKAICSLIGLVMVAMLPVVLADRLGMVSGGKRFPTTTLAKKSIIACIIIWPMFTTILLLMSLFFILGVAGYTGYVMPVLVGDYLLVATVALIFAIEYLRGGNIIRVLKRAYSYIQSDLTNCLTLGIVEAIVFIIVLQVTLGSILIPMIPMTLDRVLIAIPLALIVFTYFLFHEYLFRGQIQEIFGGRRRSAAIISISLSLTSKIVIIILISAIVYYFSPSTAVVSVGFIGMVLVALLTEGLAATSYYATREILPHALASAIVWTCIAAAAFPIVHML